MLLLYLDQNYASRIAKHLLGQVGHQPFDQLYERLLALDTLICPVSPFHILELRGGYLCPPFQSFFPTLQRGYWVRPWQEILQRQRISRVVQREDFLTTEGSWDQAADLQPLAWIDDYPLEGHLNKRIRQARTALCERLDLPPEDGTLPFLDILARIMAFRSLNHERDPRSSDLADMLIAATTTPYVDILATDRFVRETLDRTGCGQHVYSGRYPDVYRLLRDLDRRFPSASPPAEATNPAPPDQTKNASS